MGLAENSTAAAIVNTNHVREELNLHKTRANARLHGADLIICSARDINRDDNKLVSSNHRTDLLKMNTSSLTNSGGLPGVLPLYIGMPVILRMRNLSTELGVTNGSQGFLMKVVTEELEDHTLVPKVAIVHFPGSKVKLHGLPDGFFPIEPVSWSFTVQTPSAPHRTGKNTENL
ncbi:hypothetical protein DFP72DRAFT_834245 [Ephemerocybe angulata]|uniref:DNA helicase n=1 Tax=Ephemerocybe angulata TaxID=980116 RepID=A0A8H6H6K7_9AGAR|nr:hypothetical protein DFP72DRAFT_834245 [Tulosesus angulatus]